MQSVTQILTSAIEAKFNRNVVSIAIWQNCYFVKFEMGSPRFVSFSINTKMNDDVPNEFNINDADIIDPYENTTKIKLYKIYRVFNNDIDKNPIKVLCKSRELLCKFVDNLPTGFYGIKGYICSYDIVQQNDNANDIKNLVINHPNYCIGLKFIENNGKLHDAGDFFGKLKPSNELLEFLDSDNMRLNFMNRYQSVRYRNQLIKDEIKSLSWDQLIKEAENYGYPSLEQIEEIKSFRSNFCLFLTLFPCWLSDLYLGEKFYIPNNNGIWEKTSANRIKNLDSGEIKTTLNIRVNPL